MAISKDKKKKRRGDEDLEKFVPENATESAFTGPSYLGGLVNPQGVSVNPMMWRPEMGGGGMAQPQETRSEYAITKERLADPVGYEQRQTAARQARDPWGPGGLFEGRGAADLYTPEEILASQGNTAQNQILRNRRPIEAEQAKALSGVPAAQRAVGEFDPEELARQNEIYRANRTYI